MFRLLAIMNLKQWISILMLLVASVNGSRILAIFPVPAISHYTVADNLLERLARLGHEVTIITPSPRTKAPIPRYTEIDISDIADRVDLDHVFKRTSLPPAVQFAASMPKLAEGSEMFLKHPKIQKLIKAKKTRYDLIISDVWMTYSLMSGLSHKFGAPIIAISPRGPNILTDYLVGNPSTAGYIPEMITSHTDHMTLCGRLTNVLTHALLNVVHRWYYVPAEDRLIRKYFGHHLPPIADILTNTSLVFSNQHVSFSYPRPNVPNMVDVGGVHLRRPLLLPVKVKEFLDNSTNGVIVVSLGSKVNKSSVGPATVDVLKKTFSKTKLNVLWKYDNEEEEMIDKPKNVFLWKWLPQSEVLAHSNVKLFITSGGTLSLIEAIARKVPFVGIPLNTDQVHNMVRAQSFGLGVTLDLEDLTVDKLSAAVEEVLENPKYRQNIDTRGDVLLETPMTSRETAVYWVEYVLKHNGAQHIKSTSTQELTYLQQHSVDVLLLLITVLLIYTYLVNTMFRNTFMFLKSKRSEVEVGENTSKKCN